MSQSLKNTLLIPVIFLAFISCRDKELSGAGKESDFNKQKDLFKPKPANCLDTLKMLRKSPGEYDAYLKSLKERARQTPFTAIPGYKPDEPQELPPGYEYMIFKDSDLPDSLKIPYTIKKATK